MNSGKQRIGYLDAAKGICMICIIAGHYVTNPIVKNAIFTFHVPVFFIVSGFFFSGDPVKIKNNCKRLLSAYCLTAVLLALADVAKYTVKARGITVEKLWNILGKWLLAALYGSGSRSYFLNLNLPIIGAVWFLLSLIWAQMILYLFILIARRISKRETTQLIFSGGGRWLV